MSSAFLVFSLLIPTTPGRITLPEGTAKPGHRYSAEKSEEFTHPPPKNKEKFNLGVFVVNGSRTSKGGGRSKYTARSKTTRNTVRRTAPFRDTYQEQCEYISKHCLRTYKTGRLCGRTLFNKYQTFENYCMLDYVNCRERYEVWQVMHMGECYEPKEVTEFIHQTYNEDFFLDTDYVPDDLQWEW